MSILNPVIALVEDDVFTSELIKHHLMEGDYQCLTFSSIKSFMDEANLEEIDVLLLDWELEDGNSSKIIDHVRNKQKLGTPIVILSVHDDTDHISHTLNLGADDYIRKPIGMQELHSRINALMRMLTRTKDKELIGKILIDNATNTLSYQDKEIKFTPRQIELIRYFIKNPNREISRQELAKAVWNRSMDVESRTLDVHINQIRNRLVDSRCTQIQIRSIHGVGYELTFLEA